MKVLAKTVSLPNLLEDTSSLDSVLATEGWHTLMTFTRESARTSFLPSPFHNSYLIAARPPASAPPPSSHMDEDIPQELLDQIAAEEATHASGPSGSGLQELRVCPHCTFENDHDRPDCEVCGLPL